MANSSSYRVQDGTLTIISTSTARLRASDIALTDVHRTYKIFFYPDRDVSFASHYIELQEQLVEVTESEMELPDYYKCELTQQYGRCFDAHKNRAYYWNLTDGDYLWFVAQLLRHSTTIPLAELLLTTTAPL